MRHLIALYSRIVTCVYIRTICEKMYLCYSYHVFRGLRTYHASHVGRSDLLGNGVLLLYQPRPDLLRNGARAFLAWLRTRTKCKHAKCFTSLRKNLVTRPLPCTVLLHKAFSFALCVLLQLLEEGGEGAALATWGVSLGFYKYRHMFSVQHLYNVCIKESVFKSSFVPDVHRMKKHVWQFAYNSVLQIDWDTTLHLNNFAKCQTYFLHAMDIWEQD